MLPRSPLLGLATLLLATLPLLATAEASVDEAGAIVRLINDARTDAGLGRLKVYLDLEDDAVRHAAQMAETGMVWNVGDLSQVATGWTSLGQFHGAGNDVRDVHGQATSSERHRTHVLGDWDRVGVGTAHDADGQLYVALFFMRSVE